MKIYSLVKKNNYKKIKILGITIYKKKFLNGESIRKYLGQFLQIKFKCNIKKYYILGVKIYQKIDKFKKLSDELEQLKCINLLSEGRIRRYLQEMIQSSFTVAEQHKNVFSQFKNKHKGQTAVITATGPTLLYYKPIKDAVYIGVNSVHTHKQLKLDYWLSIDTINVRNNFEELKTKDFIKFFGQTYQKYPYLYYDNKNHHANCRIDECKNSYKFYFEHGNYSTINVDPLTQMFPDLGGCIFSAVYFTLLTGVNRIYIVGCDTQQNGYFNNDKQDAVLWSSNVVAKLMNGWKIIKNYIEIFYPDVELISVNPVGLRGMFKDVYTQSYLDANPKLKEELGDNIEILNIE